VPGLSVLDLSLLLAAVTLGVAIQGALGFGYALVAAPVMALVAPTALPTTLIFLALPLTAFMAARERHAVDWRGLGWILAGRVLGTAAGAALLLAVPSSSLSILFGSMIVVAVLLSALGPGLEAEPRTQFVGGVASGVMGTAAAIGGPALAVVYQRRSGPELRSTLALSFVVGLLLSLAALGVAGEVHGWQAVLALWLVPAMVVGIVLSPVLAARLDTRWLRPAVLAFAAVAGVAAIVEASLG
jgi:uncharacterized membrane protein YfcA